MRTCTIDDLTNGTTYTFTVTATNARGTSSRSAPSDPVTPVTVPAAPTEVIASALDKGASVWWQPPSNTGGSPITSYTATSSPPGSICTTTSATTCTVTGLTNGTHYTFTVTARNDQGPSLASMASDPVTPEMPVTPTVPAAPTGVTASAGNASAAVSWHAPSSNGGSLVTGYTATSTPGTRTCTATSVTTCTVTRLTNGTAYTFTVTATNAQGASLASMASDPVTPVTAPAAPTGVTASPRNASAVVSWSSPSNTGGSPITGYTAISNPDRRTCTATRATTCTVTRLTNGTAYTFTVTADNVDGTSEKSDPSPAVTPTGGGGGTIVRPGTVVRPGGGGGGGGGVVVEPEDPGPPDVTTSRFSDIPEDAFYLTHVEHIADLEITAGYGDGTYRPDEPVSRAQMAVFLSHVVTGNPPDVTTSRFSDIPDDAFYLTHVEHIADLEITAGYGDGTYRPDEPVSRAQMAVFLSHVVTGNPPDVTTSRFSDIPEDAFYLTHVEHIADLEITAGYGDGTYRPDEPVSRAQMAVFLSHVVTRGIRADASR